ncbi:hypothetical protein [Methylobacter tundripaludum]|uniref:Uncharacterized protein n=1 Tax=Methylobacter tundripaludum (strain ATCC BAA-1195 / DSM 17260 / SV96) TaxID=697282 RepID=G3IWB1_METTV|nr:hypothetical protein [Methylobacter tundripaludum]EGW23046.1 hypothetical protein Mettu_1884 [Methylobacter tundripaludum SV96]
MRVIIGLVFFIGFLGVCNAKCLFMPLVTAEIEFEQCQGVKFDASKSKIDWFPGKPEYIQQQGETIVGTLIVGKIKSSGFEQKKSGYKTPSSWRKGSIKTLFIERDSQEICPEVFPGTYRVKQSERCCDVLPFSGECLVPSTISVVEIMKSTR